MQQGFEQRFDDRRLARERLSKPLLMLHIMDTGSAALDGAFGISFPASNSDVKINYKINNVAWEQEYGAAE